jgi:transposase
VRRVGHLQKDAKVCVRVAGAGRRKTSEVVTTWGSTTRQVLALRDHLIEQRVTCAVMEATGDYWKPFYYLLEDAGFEVLLVTARHVKNLPGRKSDVSDAVWLAQLGAHGLVRGSFVPPEPIRQLRDLTRTRTALTRERAREVQRLEKLLEDAGIKLSAVASDIMGVSGRAMLQALVDGHRDPGVLADLAKRRLRTKIPALTEALTGRFTDHHAFLVGLHLDLIDRHTAAIEEISGRIEVVMEPFGAFRDLICTIPGVGPVAAEVIVAEIGDDMTRFPTAGHLASWAGTAPGKNESAGKTKSTATRPGNPYLQGALGAAAMAAAQNPMTYLGARYRRIATRRGPQKANVAVQRSILTAIWHMGTTGTLPGRPTVDRPMSDAERVARNATVASGRAQRQADSAVRAMIGPLARQAHRPGRISRTAPRRTYGGEAASSFPAHDPPARQGASLSARRLDHRHQNTLSWGAEPVSGPNRRRWAPRLHGRVS